MNIMEGKREGTITLANVLLNVQQAINKTTLGGLTVDAEEVVALGKKIMDIKDGYSYGVFPVALAALLVHTLSELEEELGVFLKDPKMGTKDSSFFFITNDKTDEK